MNLISQKIIFTSDECKKIINYHTEIHNIYDSSKEKRLHVNYLAYNIPNNEKYGWIFERILNFFIESTSLKINKLPEIVHLHRYELNSEFIKHHDKNKPERMWNIGVQLNEQYIGGNLNLFYDETVTVSKDMGTSYIFRPETYHEVTKITYGERWSLILFLHHDNIVNDLSKKTLF